jgi:hypothetical protein
VISSVTGGFEINDRRIEGSQSPNRRGADPLTIPEIMAHYRIPGVSMAVIHDLAVHWRNHGESQTSKVARLSSMNAVSGCTDQQAGCGYGIAQGHRERQV